MSEPSDPGLKDFYEEKALTYPVWDEPAYARCEKAVQLAGVADDATVLDVACKDAVLLHALRAQGRKVRYTGVDISERVIAKNVEAKLEGVFLRADISQGLPLGDGTFDRVFALEIMEHLPRPERLLAEFRARPIERRTQRRIGLQVPRQPALRPIMAQQVGNVGGPEGKTLRHGVVHQARQGRHIRHDTRSQ